MDCLWEVIVEIVVDGVGTIVLLLVEWVVIRKIQFSFFFFFFLYFLFVERKLCAVLWLFCGMVMDLNLCEAILKLFLVELLMLLYALSYIYVLCGFCRKQCILA